ncbi:SDR family NAD(P)-dependent oxidoreductase [Paeniglutamicibacter cryotolerans]|uniref:Ketoreductase RED2 n=1 Tax=Paeniglutamicibacter cryotolerans TaxID=670079 RepID=A0A839QIC0_9MICC|nr:SDR family oxidoreductase [Paeniglutamicibacter cryotolerans]MBB2995527.1 ketoreductase RED2 [Paeniglutamicibacter cryotolerans]
MNRVALVTGASSGIGKAIALRLLEEGWKVALNGFNSLEAGRQVAAGHGQAIYLDADVSSATEAKRLVDLTVEHFGRLDAVVNNAGIARQIDHSDLDAVDDEFWDLVMAVNLKGPWNVARAARAHLLRSQGQIINNASVAGITASGSSIPYAVSKAGVLHLTRLLAKALGPDIRVNAVAPGYIDTPLTHDWTAVRDFVAEKAPARRLGQPEDVAEVVHGLLSMSYVTGTVIPVAGGLQLLSGT